MKHKTLIILALIIILGIVLRFWSITSVGLSAGDVGIYIRTLYGPYYGII